MAWWLWACAGLGLLIAEVAIGADFFLFFFGLGAIFTSLIAASGLVVSTDLQLFIFSFFSIVTLVLFRGRLKGRQGSNVASTQMDKLVGEKGVAIGGILQGSTGTVELRGSGWSARNTGDAAIAAGDRFEVLGRDGLTLLIRRII